MGMKVVIFEFFFDKFKYIYFLLIFILTNLLLREFT